VVAFAIGGGAGKPIYESVKSLASQVEALSLAVSYIQLSGWELLAELIPPAKLPHTRILCTDQLGITDPKAVRAIKAAGVTIRAFTAADIVFHSKVYIGQHANGSNRFVLGSANLSRSALLTGVEVDINGEDPDGTLLDWFEQLFNDPERCADFDDARIEALERAYAARLKSRLAYQRTIDSVGGATAADPSAAMTLESAFTGLEGELMPLNIDKGGSTVRTLRYVEKLLNGPVPLKADKSAGDMGRLGFASDLHLTPLGQAAAGKNWGGIAQFWAAWLKDADEKDLLAINPTGRLVQARLAFETFWTFPSEVTDFFLEKSEGAKGGTRALCATIELLANAGRPLPSLSLDDVATLSTILDATTALPPAARESVQDYLGNKGTRGWNFPDRRLILEAWRDTP
jgi:HKD family nuclease